MAIGKYKEWVTADGLLLIEGWARDGLTDEMIAGKIGINRTTLYKWISDHPDIGDALKKGRRPVAYEVENSFIKLALGYKVTLKKPIKLRREKQKQGEGKIVEEYIEYADEEIYIKPETANQIFYLKNKMPSKYKDKATPLEEMDSIKKLDELIKGIDNAAKS